VSAPCRYFVRVWTPDPEEQGPDNEEDRDVANEETARLFARRLRAQGQCAGAFERRNIRYPDHAPPGLDLPAHLYEWESRQLDEDEE